MAVQQNSKSNVSRHIELIIRKISSVSTLPSVLTAAIGVIKNNPIQVDEIAKIIESEPSLCSIALQSAANSCPQFNDTNFSAAKACQLLSPQVLSDIIMSAKIYRPLLPDKTPVRVELIKFALATAIASKEIAEIVNPDISDLAFSAGLMHNIGKLALDDAMPKSFEKITDEAKNFGEKDITIERKYLGIDHIIIGKRLAEKWKFPQAMTNAIWMHRSDEEVIKNTLPEDLLVIIVRLGYLIAKNSQLADCGSYEPLDISDEILQSLTLTEEQTDNIQKILPDKLKEKISLLNLDSEVVNQNYSQIVWEFATKLVQDNAKLLQQNISLSQSSANMNFANDFLSSISSSSQPADIACSLALNLQKYYSAAPICICLVKPQQSSTAVETIVMSKDNSCDTVIVSCSNLDMLIPQEIKSAFKVIDPQDKYNWLFSQLDVNFDISKTKVFPVIVSNRAVAIIVCQFAFLPSNPEQYNRIASAICLAGPALCFAYACQSQQKLAEDFSALLARLGNIKEKLSQTDGIQGLAELAGGAAHELNNPITVVSGRIQLLLADENNEKTKETLNLVKDKIEEISNIVSDLMTFAKPHIPVTRLVSPAVLIDSAVDLVREKLGNANIQIQIENLDNLRDIYVDAEQTSRAIANLIANALESYMDTGGLVRITGAEQSENSIRIQIIDKGCGMDSATLQKAKQPFFSGKPAGRKRGMGLSHSLRLLQINNGSLHLASKIGQGTTATVMLPCK